MKLLSIVIPFLNEEVTLLSVLDAIRSVDLQSIGYEYEIILVNDGSVDSSEKLVQQYMRHYPTIKIHYLSHHPNHGKGYALKKGFAHATGDVLLVQDADMEYDPQDYIALLSALDKHSLDFVYGSRTRGIRKFGNNYSSVAFLFGGFLVSAITSLLAGRLITDEPTCYKVFSKKLQPYLLQPVEDDFAREPAITMLLLKKGFRYGEVPIHYTARDRAHGKKIKWQDGLKALHTLWKYRFSR